MKQFADFEIATERDLARERERQAEMWARDGLSEDQFTKWYGELFHSCLLYTSPSPRDS